MQKEVFNNKFHVLAFTSVSVYFLLATVVAVQSIEFARVTGVETTYGSYLMSAFKSFPMILSSVW